jgi:hypothetical protein
MPYNSSTAGVLITLVKKECSNLPGFRAANIQDTEYFHWLNETLDEVYLDCFTEEDLITFTTVVNDWDYIIDGTGPPAISASIADIVRLDYDEVPLDPVVAKTDILLPTASSTSGTPEHWFMLQDGGARYICFDVPPDTAVTVRLWTTKMATAITGTTGVPVLDKDFWALLRYALLQKVMFRLADWDRYQECVRQVERWKLRVAAHQARRRGLRAEYIKTMGPRDYFE